MSWSLNKECGFAGIAWMHAGLRGHPRILRHSRWLLAGIHLSSMPSYLRFLAGIYSRNYSYQRQAGMTVIVLFLSSPQVLSRNPSILSLRVSSPLGIIAARVGYE